MSEGNQNSSRLQFLCLHFNIIEVINVIRLLKECDGRLLFAVITGGRVVNVFIRSHQLFLASRHYVDV